MKKFKLINAFALLLIISSNLIFGVNDLYAQTKKNRARINADYVNVVGEEHYLNIKASARIDKKTVALSNLDLIILQESNGKETEIGKAVTNASGTSKFTIHDFSGLQPDSLGVYNLVVSFEGNEELKKASRNVTFRNANIKVEWIERDSINYVKAKFIDTQLDSAIGNIPLGVRVDRLFRPLKIGEDSYRTDDQGEIEVAIEDGIPGIDRNLQIEIVLNESDDYGTVIGQVTAPIGTLIVDESTFDKRTMWSPRGKTPIFLLTLTYSFIFIVWGIFLYLFINFIRIFKS